MKICFLLLLLIGCAETKYRVKKPFLYEVSKGRMQGHLLGTIHLGVTSKDLPPEFWPYFNESDAYVAEIDTTKGNEGLFGLVQERMLRSPYEKPLVEQLDKDTFNRLKNIVVADKVTWKVSSDQVLDRLSLYGAYLYAHQGVEQQYNLDDGRRTFGNVSRLRSSMDFELGALAREQGKSILTLDELSSEAFVSCMMEEMYGSKELVLQNLKELLNGKTLPLNLDRLFEMIEAYRLGEVAYFENVKGASQCLLQDRNEMWVGKIMAHMGTYKRPFIAVGLFHLEHSSETVIDMLRENGYQVKRIPLVYKD